MAALPRRRGGRADRRLRLRWSLGRGGARFLSNPRAPRVAAARDRYSALRALPPGQRFVPFDVASEHLGFDEYDVVGQGLISHHYYPQEGVQVSMPFRYVWPSELDLMARIAGMRLRERWGGWRREPFTAESGKHVSVWTKL